MTEKIKEALAGRDPYEALVFESVDVYEEETGSRRWWIDTFKVVKLGDLLIGFDYAKTTGDDSLSDIGWEFDESTICEVEQYEHKETRYRPAQKRDAEAS